MTNSLIFLACFLGFIITQQYIDSKKGKEKFQAEKVMLDGKLVYKFQLENFLIYADTSFPFYILMRAHSISLVKNPITHEYFLVHNNKKQAIPVIKFEKINNKI